MRSFLGICLFVGFSVLAEASFAKNQSFVDRVYKIKTLNEKSYISFHREPVIYEVEKKDSSLLKALEQSKGTQVPVAVTIDSVSKKILKVKVP